jgi:predicted Zn-dependent peptidase
VRSPVAPNYNLTLSIATGSASDRLSGTAHLLEHLKFKTRAAQSLASFRKIPGTESNASTTWQVTEYRLVTPPGNLDAGLAALQNVRMPLDITEEDLEQERRIVNQEILERTRADPDIDLYSEFNSKLFAGTPLARWPVGKPDELNTITLQDVIAFDRTHNLGQTSLLTVTGPGPTKTIARAIAKYFPGANCGFFEMVSNSIVIIDDANLRTQPPLIEPITHYGRVVGEFRIEKSSTHSPFTSIKTSTLIRWQPDRTIEPSMLRLLQGIMNSRLNDGLSWTLRDQLNLTDNPTVEFSVPFDHVLQLDFFATLRSGTTEKTVMDAYESYLENLIKFGVHGENFKRVKRRLVAEDQRSWGDPEIVAKNLSDLVLYEGFGAYVPFVQGNAPLKALALARVNDFLKTLGQESRTGLAILMTRQMGEIQNDTIPVGGGLHMHLAD